MTTSIITGSASGIGAATRARLEADGERVIGIDLARAEVDADLSHADGRAHAVAAALALCDGRCDRLVLSAGLAESAPLPAVASVNYFGAVALLDGLFPALAEGKRAAAVVLSSNSARLAPLDDTPFVKALLDGDEPGARRIADAERNTFLAYGGSKLALAIAIRRRAMEWGQAGVRLNAIAPGPTETPLLDAVRSDPGRAEGLRRLPNPLGRHASPEEIADIIVFLLGPQAGYIHGAVLYADAGIDAAVHPDRL